MMTFSIPEMTCGHCVATVTKAIQSLDHAARVRPDLAARTLMVETSAPAMAVSKALEEAGYSNSRV